MYYIYEILNKMNDKNYIGQRRCPEGIFPDQDVKYMGSGKLIIRAREKYNHECFSKKILAVTEKREVIEILEKFFITMYKSEGKAEYNISEGGQGGNLGEECNRRISLALKGHPVSEETRKKFRETRKGRVSPNKGKKMSEEQKKKLSESHKGKGHPVSEETRKKISATLKGHPVSEETRKKISVNTKMAMTDEVCRKISEKNIIRFSNIEERRKLSEAHKGKIISEEHRRKISESLRRRYNEF